MEFLKSNCEKIKLMFEKKNFEKKIRIFDENNISSFLACITPGELKGSLKKISPFGPVVRPARANIYLWALSYTKKYKLWY